MYMINVMRKQSNNIKVEVEKKTEEILRNLDEISKIIPLHTEYSILPSTRSVIFEMMFLLILFILFIIYIIYLAAYDTGYKPNFVMFLNFIFNDYDTKGFKGYIQSIIGDFTKRENFTSHPTETFISKIQDGFYQQLSSFFVSGNKMKINKHLYNHVK